MRPDGVVVHLAFYPAGMAPSATGHHPDGVHKEEVVGVEVLLVSGLGQEGAHGMAGPVRFPLRLELPPASPSRHAGRIAKVGNKAGNRLNTVPTIGYATPIYINPV